ncbi:MAG: PKD domain-containing protein [Thermoplasmata archaeon]|nr:MAG: PKD domain-containing protein [Thermoplasmata archaeon]
MTVLGDNDFDFPEQGNFSQDPILPLGSPLPPEDLQLPSQIRIWEAWAKGYATIYQQDFATYVVNNNGPVSVIIDEYVLLMSPSPAYPDEDLPLIDDETQDGILTITYAISPGNSLTYNYGHYVAMAIEPPPPWWCTEDSELTNAGIEISLGGEILPYNMVPLILNYNINTQDDVWYHLRNNPAVVIGKTPLWEEIANIGDEVDITLDVTNLGFIDATNIVVTDTIPADYSYDPSSFTQTPSSITNNSDGSVTLKWDISQIDAAVETPNDEPTDYTTEYISYKLITPVLDPDLRIFLPRAYVDWIGDNNDDAESEEPLLETYLVNRPPVAIVDDVVIDEGETAYLNGSDSYDPDEPFGDYIVSYEWDFDGDNYPDDYGPVVSKTYGDNGIFTVTLTVTDSYGERSSATANITVNNVVPSIDTLYNVTIDEGQTGSFSARATDPGSDDLTITWNWGDGTSDTVTIYYNDGLGPDPYPSPDVNPMDITDSVTHTYMDDGVYLVTLTVDDDDNGVSQATFYVHVNDLAPNAEFTWSPEPQNEASPVQFTDLSTSYPDSIVAWYWDFAGLGTNNSQNPQFTFMEDGIYTVTLTVYDDDNSTASISHNVTILDLAPRAEFTWSPEPQDEGSPVSFFDLSSSYPDAIVAWSWDFAGLGTNNSQNPQFTFMDDGIYPVTLTVWDEDNSSYSVTHNVTISDLAPTANFTWSPEPQDEGSPVSFTDLSTSYPDTIVAWEWDFAGLGTNKSQNPQFTFMNNGIYTVTLTVYDDDNSTDSVSYNVTILDLAPTAEFTWSPEPQDEGSPVQFTDLSTSYPDSIVAWEWDFAGLGTNNSQNPQFTFMDDGIYLVTLTVTDDDGSKDSISHNITILDLAPTADYSWSPEPQDEGSPVSFTDLSTSYPDVIVSWAWDFDDGGTSDLQNPSHTYGDDRVYLVTLTVTDDDGSIDTISYNVTILNVAPIVDAGENRTIDEGTAISFSGSFTDPGWLDTHNATIDWGDGNVEPGTVIESNGSGSVEGSHVYGDDGVFTVTLTVVDDDGGVGTDTMVVTVNNVAPSIDALDSYSTDENSPVTLEGHAQDPGSDDLTFTWNWGDGTSDTVTIYYNDGNGPDPYPSPDVNPMDVTDTVSHTYGDNGNFTVTLTVEDDDGGQTVVTTYVLVNNVAPSIDPLESYVTDENSPVTLEGHATDPGSDDLTFTWDWGDGTSDTVTIYYNDGNGPDPYTSPEINPMDVTDTVIHTYGDNGNFTVTLTVEDDDGGQTVVTTFVIVNNVAPSIDPLDSYITDENSPVTLEGHATDPGSDDLTFTWNWGDGTSDTVTIYYNNGLGPDPYPSPEVNPMDVTDTVTHTYGDNGNFTVTLTVEDDDGGQTVVTTFVIVNNVAPTVEPGRFYEVDENTPVTLTATATDPGSDDLTFTWEFDFGPTISTIHFNDGIGPDPYPSPEINPMSILESQTHTYGDNGVFNVTLTVEDDDGGITIETIEVTVNNVAPTILNIEAYMLVNLSIRIAGEKWHSVGLHLMEDGEEVTSAIVTRRPGNPDEQIGTIANAKLVLTKSYTVLIDYLPNDPRVNGNVWGGNPVWVFITFDDGSETRLHHTFNVRQSHWNSDHWNHIDPWEVELTPYLAGHNITFEATASDPGSDDLTFLWDFGDGNSTLPHIHYNNLIGPDPYPSPDINPINCTDTVKYDYGECGVFCVTLTVMDDDGGICIMTLTLPVG